MTTVTLIGIGASILTGVAMLPQLLKIIKEKKAENISYGMLFVLMAGLAGWIWYGIMKDDNVILISNAFSFLVNLILVIAASHYKK